MLTCAVCTRPLTTADAETLVETTIGPTHPTCFERAELKPVDAVGRLGAEIRAEQAAENLRREDHGEPPLTDDDQFLLPGDRADGFDPGNV